MPYNPAVHHRHSIRLKGYDYSQEGLYFVTICVQNRKCVFGKILDGEMILNECGKIAQKVWEELPQHYNNIELGEFVVMPNHIHGIIAIVGIISVWSDLTTPPKNTGNPIVGATLAVARNEQHNRAGASPAPTDAVPIVTTLGQIVGAYKSFVANKCLKIFKLHGKYMGKLWQRNYWEHIIRNGKSHQYIADYIINNPATWENDELYTE